MAWLLFAQRLGWDDPVPYAPGVNLRPLDTVRLMWPLLKGTYGRHLQLFAAANLAGNVALFVPAGLFLPVLFRPMRRLWLFVVTSVSAIAAVEGAQYFFRLGSCDVDDLILNVIGMAAGWVLYRLFEKQEFDTAETKSGTDPPGE